MFKNLKKWLMRKEILQFENFEIKIKRSENCDKLYSKFTHDEFAIFLFGLEKYGISYRTCFGDRCIKFKFFVFKPTFKIRFLRFQMNLDAILEMSDYIKTVKHEIVMDKITYVITLT